MVRKRIDFNESGNADNINILFLIESSWITNHHMDSSPHSGKDVDRKQPIPRFGFFQANGLCPFKKGLHTLLLRGLRVLLHIV